VKYMTLRTILFVSILLCPAALSPQMPPQPGKLVISSYPTDALIAINGKQVSQHTNATFLVSPGTYQIEVASTDGRIKCSGALTVAAGQTAGATCTATGWKPG
jgi:hypothetical protein